MSIYANVIVAVIVIVTKSSNQMSSNQTHLTSHNQKKTRLQKCPSATSQKKKKIPSSSLSLSLKKKERKKARKTLFFTENYVGSLVFSFFSFFVLVRVFTEKTGTQRTFLSLPLFSFFVYYLFLSFLFHHQAFIFIIKLSAFSSLSPLSLCLCSSFCFWACGLFLFCISVI